MTRPAADSIKVVWNGSGTGTISLGAVVAGYVAFPSALNGQLVSYIIAHDTAAERETGYGVYTHSGTTLSRVFVTSPVFGGSKVAFSVGTKHVGVAPLASDIIENRDTINPGVNDDISTGYIRGRSRWLNTSTDALFFCVDDTDGAAVWIEVGGGGAGGGSVDTANAPAAGEFAKFTDANTIEGRTAAETRADLGLVIGTNVQAAASALTTLSTAWTTASSSGPARLSFHEDTDNGSMAASLAAPAALSDNINIVLPSTAGTLLRKEDVATGVLTGIADDLNLSGGVDGDVLTKQADGSLAMETPSAATVNVDQWDIVARVAAGTGSAGGISAGDLTLATPVTGDFLPFWLDTGELRKADASTLIGGGGGGAVLDAETITTTTDSVGVGNTQVYRRYTNAGSITVTIGDVEDNFEGVFIKNTGAGTLTLSGSGVTLNGAATFVVTGMALVKREDAGTGLIVTHVPAVAVIAIADVTGLQVALDAKAPTANPVFTGTVTIPDAALAIADTSGLQTALDGKIAEVASDISPTLGGALDCATFEVFGNRSPFQTMTGSQAASASGRSWKITGNATAVPITNGWFAKVVNTSGSAKTITPVSGSCVITATATTQATATLGDDKSCVLHGDGTNLIIDGAVT